MRTTVFFQRHISWYAYNSMIFTMSIPVLFMFLLSFSPTRFGKLDLVHSTSKVNITSTTGGQEEMVIGLAFGASGGCMWYGDEARICKPTFHLQPSPTYLHLPSNQTLSEHMGNTNGLVLIHITTVLVSLGQIFWAVGPFVPGCFETSNVFMLLSLLWGTMTFFTICGTKLSLENRLKDSYPTFKTDYGGGLGLYILGMFFILCAMLGTMSVSGKIERKGPPAPAEGV